MRSLVPGGISGGFTPLYEHSRLESYPKNAYWPDPMFEHYFQCPYCWETISVLVDLSVPAQTYVEDCEVCCNPMEITVTCSEGELLGFEARELGQ